MTYCSQCGRKVVVLLNLMRNPRSYWHRQRKTLKDHDLCRQCYRSMMSAVLAEQRT